MSLTPSSLLDTLKSWTSISNHEANAASSSYWTIKDQNVCVEKSNNSLVNRVHSLWQGRQDLSHVFHNMHTIIQKAPREQINDNDELKSELTKLKEQITQRTNKYLASHGLFRSLYRSMNAYRLQSPGVEAKANKLLEEVNELLKICKTPKVAKAIGNGNVDEDFHSYSLPKDKDLRPILVSEIEKAEKSITIFMYSINDLQVMEALENKAKNGVSVRILCDKDAFNHAKRKFDPSITVEELECKGLMHLKIIVLDDERVIFGSTNLTTGGLTKDTNIMTVMKSKELAKKVLNRAKDYSQPEEDKKVIELSQGRKIDFIFLPDTKADKKLIKLIEGAKKTLDIALYTWTHSGVADAVIKKHQEGVKVTTVIDGNQGGPKGSGNEVTQKLKKAGIEVILPKANKFKLQHHKFVRIDGNEMNATVVHGSANWTKAAFKENMDCLAVLKDLTESDRKNFDSIWNDLTTSMRKKVAKQALT